jgi:hypothetical protein
VISEKLSEGTMVQIQIDLNIDNDGHTTRMSGIVLQSSNATTKEVNLANEILRQIQNSATCEVVGESCKKNEKPE